jgi:23S rRNA (adenine2503-C2)-methyltransferase
MEKQPLLGLTFEEIAGITSSLKLPPYTARQICSWIYGKNINDISLMTDISEKNRALLNEFFIVGKYPPLSYSQSHDGTKKYLFRLGNNKFIETVYIPEEDRATLCISSQVGCKMGCKFCQTGKQGFNGQLTSTDIINQIYSIPEFLSLTNIVLMGMGEPFDNYDEVIKCLNILTSKSGFGWSPKRITVSTIGIIPSLQRFLIESKCNIAISLHSPFHEERLQLMPVEKVYPIEKIIELLRNSNVDDQRRLSFEYILFKNLNDTPQHVKGLAKLLNGLKCRINLIRFHQIPDIDLQPSDNRAVLEFQKQLKAKGIMTTIRASRGEDILAACGLLSTKALSEK